MIIIEFNPQRSDSRIEISAVGDAITINGEVFDFSPLQEGGFLPFEAIGSSYFSGPAYRKNQNIYLSLIYPYDPNIDIGIYDRFTINIENDGHVEINA